MSKSIEKDMRNVEPLASILDDICRSIPPVPADLVHDCMTLFYPLAGGYRGVYLGKLRQGSSYSRGISVEKGEIEKGIKINERQ